jgi:hypothetical protein
MIAPGPGLAVCNRIPRSAFLLKSSLVFGFCAQTNTTDRVRKRIRYRITIRFLNNQRCPAKTA